ncbi:MAG: putative N6-adenine-specific DNA methylase [Clostridium sp.]|jgi:putative N6-adenine-specific DNA methylase
MLARANLWSRCGERIMIFMGEFTALSFEELFQGVRALPWERWIGRKDAFPVKGSSLSSKLKSVPDCQAIVKKAIVERLKQKYSVQWFEETGTKYQIRFLILKDRVSLMIDTSGEGLHKRGYRANSAKAPDGVQ